MPDYGPCGQSIFAGASVFASCFRSRSRFRQANSQMATAAANTSPPMMAPRRFVPLGLIAGRHASERPINSGESCRVEKGKSHLCEAPSGRSGKWGLTPFLARPLLRSDSSTS